MKLFDLNGPLMTALGKLADIVICNILFCLFSLPVLTAGASLAALYTCMQSLISEEEKDEGLIFREFWRAFKRNFRQATLLWLICLLCFGFLFAYYWITGSMSGAAGKLYQVTFYLLTLLFLFGFQYLFPLQARYQNKIRYTLRNAWLLSIAALPWSILALAVPVLAVYLSFFMNPRAGNTAIYLWAVCGFGLVAYLDSFFFRRAFLKISPAKEPAESAVPEGALFTDEAHRKEDLLVQESSFSDPNWNRRDDLLGIQPTQIGKKKNRKG